MKHFNHAGLELTFGASKPEPEIAGHDPILEEQRRQELEAIVKEEERERLRLEDPYEYEQLMKQELEANGS